MNKVAFIFHQAPHQVTSGREGLDAILATSNYSEDIALFFVGEGVLQLLKDQQPDHILSRNYASAFKLLDLYDLEQRYICSESLQQWGIAQSELIIDGECLSPQELADKLSQFDNVLSF